MVITIGIRETKDSYGSVFPAKDFVKGRGTGRLAGRVVTEGVVSETVFRQPDPRLHGIVAGAYQGWREVSSEVVRRREVPACEIPFIINFGATFGLIDPARPGAATRRLGTFVAGVHDSYVIVESSGDWCCIQVNFTLPGARQFFQVPLGELSNRSVELGELFGDQSADGRNSRRDR